MNKGQVFVSDLTASITIFSFFILLLGVAWNISADMFLDGDKTEIQTDYAFSNLNSNGHPENWNQTNVKTPGLYNNGYFNKTKFRKLMNLSLQEKRRLLQSQEFILKAEYLNGTLLSKNGEKLKINSSNIPRDNAVYVRRTLSVDHESKKRMKLSYYAWRE